MAIRFFDTPSMTALLASIIPFLILDFVVVIARFYVRRRLRQKFMLDDWLMIPALIGVAGLASIYFYGIGSKALGYRWVLLPAPGTDINDPNYVPETAEPGEQRIRTTRRLEYSSLILYAFTNGTIKISVLSLYRRIFVIVPSLRDMRNLFFLGFTTLIAMWSVSYIFAFMFMCRKDIQVLFMNPELLQQKCVDTFMVGYSYSISDFMSDGLILLIPLPFIWQLHLPIARKLAVIAVFLMGILASGSSLVRLAWMVYNVKVGFGDSTDEELMITTELYWMMLEITLGLIASCLPTLRGLFKTNSVDSMVKGVRSIFSLRSGSGSGSGSFKTKMSKVESHEKEPISVTEYSRGSGSVDRV